MNYYFKALGEPKGSLSRRRSSLPWSLSSSFIMAVGVLGLPFLESLHVFKGLVMFCTFEHLNFLLLVFTTLVGFW